MSNRSRISTEFVIETDERLSLEDLCEAINSNSDFIISLIEQDLLEPHGNEPASWEFDLVCYKRAKRAASFHHDLEINMPGIALALDLLDKIDRLESELVIKGASFEK